MKWYALLLSCITAVTFCACEQHSVAELDAIEHTEGSKPAEAPAAPEKPKAEAPAPKFFPEKK